MGRARIGLLAVAVAAVLGGLLAAPQPPPWWQLGFAVAVGLLVYLLRQRIRVGTSVVAYAWCEVALLVGLFLVPAGWVPLLIAVSVVGAAGLQNWRQRAVPRLLPEAASTHVIAASVGALLCLAVADPYQAVPSPEVVAGLLLAAVGYFVTVTVALRLLIAGRSQLPVWQSHRLLWRRELAVSIRNTAIGLTAVAVAGLDQRWLLVLPPVLWLLNRAHRYQARASERRRMWSALATATQSLNQPDLAEVATAGAQGALDVFVVARAEVVLGCAGGARRVWAADLAGGVRELAELPAPADTVVPLLRGPDEIGQLHVHFPRVAGPGADEDAALHVYGAALAAAVHETGTYQQLHGLLARSARDAQHDPLTGLFSRAALLTRGETAVQLTQRARPVTLLVVDVDHFREINDTLGHSAGDEVLRVTAQRLQDAARPGELLGRLGGDEFALLVVDPPGRPDDASVSGNGSSNGTRNGTRNGNGNGNGTRNGNGNGNGDGNGDGNGGRTGGNGRQGDRAGPPGYGARPAAGRNGSHAALHRGRELVARLAAAAEIGGVPLPIGVTVGVVTAPAGTADLTELLRRADTARHHARTGRGQTVGRYDPAQDTGRADRPALLAELREALTRDDELVLMLQPVVDLATETPTELEALVRWQHPRRGLLLPAEFVRVVENSDLLARFTEYVLDKALAIAAQLEAAGRAVPVAVNLSARSLLDPDLPLTVGQLLRRYRLPGRLLVLEITETVVASELPAVAEALDRLRALGIRLAVDDFGTGHASLSFLARVRLDEVKVDGGFVAQMDSSPEAAAIVATTIELGRELGLRVVAEGVETADQRRQLGALGCTAAQGFYFAHPYSPG